MVQAATEVFFLVPVFSTSKSIQGKLNIKFVIIAFIYMLFLYSCIGIVLNTQVNLYREDSSILADVVMIHLIF